MVWPAEQPDRIMAHANSNAGAPARLNRACCDCVINIIRCDPGGPRCVPCTSPLRPANWRNCCQFKQLQAEGVVPQYDKSKVKPSGPIPKFVSTRGTFVYELRNLRATSNAMILVWL